MRATAPIAISPERTRLRWAVQALRHVCG